MPRDAKSEKKQDSFSSNLSTFEVNHVLPFNLLLTLTRNVGGMLKFLSPDIDWFCETADYLRVSERQECFLQGGDVAKITSPRAQHFNFTMGPGHLNISPALSLRHEKQ